jgi:hypothetical protein
MTQLRRSAYRRRVYEHRIAIRPASVIFGLFFLGLLIIGLLFLFCAPTPHRSLQDESPFKHKKIHKKFEK